MRPAGTLVTWFLVCAAQCVAAPAETTESPDFSAPVLVDVDRVRWPAYFESTKRDLTVEQACGELTAANIKVSENGRPARVTAIDLEPLPALHLILIDTSSSMLARLDAAFHAALEYVRAVPAGERVALLSFGEDVILHVPPTTDRRAVERALDRVRVGGGTAFFDALRDLSLVIDDPEERKIVVLLTDGADSSSVRRLSIDEFAALGPTSENMSVFPIWLDVTGGSRPGSIDWLRKLAHATGGTYFTVRGAQSPVRLERGIRDVFDKIHTRRRTEGVVTYVPPQDEQGRGPLGRGSRTVRIKRNGRSVRCRVTSARSTKRTGATATVHRSQDPDELREWARRAARNPLCDPAPTGAPSWIVNTPAPLWSEKPAEGWTGALFGFSGSRTHTGFVADQLRDVGGLYDPKALTRSGQLRFDISRRPRFARRSIRFDAPPVSELRVRARGPAQVLLELLGGSCAPAIATPDDLRPQHPLLVHGRTLFELRRALATLLVTSHPDYHAFATERLKREIDLEMSRLRDALTREGLLTDGMRAALDEAARQRMARPEVERPERFVTAPLGDVRGIDAAAALDRDLANALLASERDSAGTRSRWAASVEDAWPRLSEWFHPPTSIRVVVPLVPVFDRERDVIGYYRFLLPRLESEDVLLDAIPVRPHGTVALRALLAAADGDARRRIVRSAVLDIRYEHLPAWDGRVLAEITGDARYEQASAVSLLLAVPDAPQIVTRAIVLIRGVESGVGSGLICASFTGTAASPTPPVYETLGEELGCPVQTADRLVAR